MREGAVSPRGIRATLYLRKDRLVLVGALPSIGGTTIRNFFLSCLYL